MLHHSCGHCNIKSGFKMYWKFWTKNHTLSDSFYSLDFVLLLDCLANTKLASAAKIIRALYDLNGEVVHTL